MALQNYMIKFSRNLICCCDIHKHKQNAGLSGDWVGGKHFVMCFWGGLALWGRKTQTKSPQNPRTLPWKFAPFPRKINSFQPSFCSYICFACGGWGSKRASQKMQQQVCACMALHMVWCCPLLLSALSCNIMACPSLSLPKQNRSMGCSLRLRCGDIQVRQIARCKSAMRCTFATEVPTMRIARFQGCR